MPALTKLNSIYNANRTLADSAISIYEKSMSEHLGFYRKPLEASEIRRLLQNDRILRGPTKRVVESRNKVRHRAGGDISLTQMHITLDNIEQVLSRAGCRDGFRELQELRRRASVGSTGYGRDNRQFAQGNVRQHGGSRRGRSGHAGSRRGRRDGSNQWKYAVAIFLVVLIVCTLGFDGLGLGSPTSGTLAFCVALILAVVYWVKTGS